MRNRKLVNIDSLMYIENNFGTRSRTIGSTPKSHNSLQSKNVGFSNCFFFWLVVCIFPIGAGRRRVHLFALEVVVDFGVR